MIIKEVIEIRRLYLTGDYTHRMLAKKYNVHRCTIGEVLNRYKHVKTLSKEIKEYSRLNQGKRRSINVYSRKNINGKEFGVLKIQNSKGQIYEVFYDLEDEEKIKKHSWSIPPSAIHKYPRSTINKKTCNLHRYLLNPTGNNVVDHIDQNPLNNLRENLRICTHSENQRNRGLAKHNTTGYCGVSYSRPQNSFVASIRIDGESHYIGSFHTPLLAAIAYDKHVKESEDDFSVLNFPNGVPKSLKQLAKQQRQQYQQQRRASCSQVLIGANIKKYRDIFQKMEDIISSEVSLHPIHLSKMYIERFKIKKPKYDQLVKRLRCFYKARFLNHSDFPILYRFMDNYKNPKPKKEKECTSCKRTLAVNKQNFSFNKNNRKPLSWCKKCCSAASKEYYRRKKKENK